MTSSQSKVITPECAICKDSDGDQQLMNACKCQGTIKYVHFECISSWITIQRTTKCKVCKTKYKNIQIIKKKSPFCPTLWQLTMDNYLAVIIGLTYLSLPLYLSVICLFHSSIAFSFGQLLLAYTTFIPGCFLLSMGMVTIVCGLMIFLHFFLLYRKKSFTYKVLPIDQNK